MQRSIKIIHLIFADDLMIFYKETETPVQRIMKAIKHFSKTTRPSANALKSNFFLAGVNQKVQGRLPELIGFKIRSLPIRYPRLPLSHRKWTKLDCQQLSSRIIEKLRNTSTRHLSYAGRLQVVNSVIFAQQNFWRSILLLLQSVVKMVDS